MELIAKVDVVRTCPDASGEWLPRINFELQLGKMMLHNFRAWRERRRAMREMQALQKDEDWEIVHADNNPLRQAKVSLEIDDAETALRHWNHAWARYPGYVKKAPETLDILLGLKLYSDAEAIMLEGQKCSPRESRYAEGYALVAERRGDLAEAIVRWKRVRKRFPGSWAAHVNAARALREVRRFDEAEALLQQAISRFPNTIHGWLEHARVAEAKEDWTLARSRWRQVSDQFHHVMGTLGQARALAALGKVGDAERFLSGMRMTFEYEPEVACAWANMAEIRGDTDEALERWALVRQRFPQFDRGYRESARLLRSAGRLVELDALLLDVARRLPREAPALEPTLTAHQQHG